MIRFFLKKSLLHTKPFLVWSTRTFARKTKNEKGSLLKPLEEFGKDDENQIVKTI
jgi:hypothetical protein